MKTLLVTGGSSDMALAYIKKYMDRYDTIVAQYFSHKDELQGLQEETGGKIIPFEADLSDPEAVKGLLSFLQEKELMPGYVLHCPAGKTKLMRVEEFDPASLEKEMQIEVYSIMELMKGISVSMCEQTFGRVCFILSSVTEYPVAYESPYVIAKHALLGAMKALSAELAGKKITVNAVSPSMTETKFIADTSPLVRKKAVSNSPLKRLAKPDDIADAIALFLSDENEYITGENLLIAGGGR